MTANTKVSRELFGWIDMNASTIAPSLGLAIKHVSAGAGAAERRPYIWTLTFLRSLKKSKRH